MQFVSKHSLMGATVGDLNSSHGTMEQDPIENNNADSLGFWSSKTMPSALEN